jgi:hypothetical protein
LAATNPRRRTDFAKSLSLSLSHADFAVCVRVCRGQGGREVEGGGRETNKEREGGRGSIERQEREGGRDVWRDGRRERAAPILQRERERERASERSR